MNPAILTKREIKQRLLSHRNTLKEYGVKRLGLFGSYVKSTTVHRGSDIDLLVEFEGTVIRSVHGAAYFS